MFTDQNPALLHAYVLTYLLSNQEVYKILFPNSIFDRDKVSLANYSSLTEKKKALMFAGSVYKQTNRHTHTHTQVHTYTYTSIVLLLTAESH